jgi:hypothetical protein
VFDAAERADWDKRAGAMKLGAALRDACWRALGGYALNFPVLLESLAALHQARPQEHPAALVEVTPRRFARRRARAPRGAAVLRRRARARDRICGGGRCGSCPAPLGGSGRPSVGASCLGTATRTARTCSSPAPPRCARSPPRAAPEVRAADVAPAAPAPPVLRCCTGGCPERAAALVSSGAGQSPGHRLGKRQGAAVPRAARTTAGARGAAGVV